VQYPDDMSESEAASTQTDLEALEALQADASELERIESLLHRFNAFETSVGFENDEVMHSDILASLLDPNRTGVLGELLIKEVLRETLAAGRKAVPAAAFEGLDRVLENLDVMGLSRTLVRREYQFIDVLLTNEDHKLAVIIENKIYEMALRNESVFNNPTHPDSSQWPKLYRLAFLTAESIENGSDNDLEQEIRRQWGEFLDKDLPRIEAALKKETWIWEPVEPEERT
jgi:hypothetical protein